WTWTAQNSVAEGPGTLAFWRREHVPRLPFPEQQPAGTRDDTSERVLERLRNQGASFVTDLAAEMGLPPSTVRAALWTLLRQGWVTNDRFDVIRRGEETVSAAEWPRQGVVGPRSHVFALSLSRRGRRRAGQHPEG